MSKIKAVYQIKSLCPGQGWLALFGPNEMPVKEPIVAFALCRVRIGQEGEYGAGTAPKTEDWVLPMIHTPGEGIRVVRDDTFIGLQTCLPDGTARGLCRLPEDKSKNYTHHYELVQGDVE